MTLKILKSEIDALGIVNFPAAVEAQKSEIAAWESHMSRVATDAKLPDIPQPKFSEFAHMPDSVHRHRAAIDVWRSNVATRHVPYPHPDAHPLITHAAKEGFEIIDDSPTPDQILAAKKMALLNQIARIESEMISGLVPAGKVRANMLMETDIHKADAKRSEKLSEQIMADPDKREAALEKMRPAADTAHLKSQAIVRSKADAISRSTAKIMSDIEDLTAGNIDAWRMPNLESSK